jgi:cytochrome c
MSLRPVVPALLLTILLPSHSFAAGGEELARTKGCFGCHSIRGSAIGPSFQDIASRFAPLKNAKPMLVRVVITGSNNVAPPFHWGGMKMPPDVARVDVNEAEAEQLVDYVLSVR